MKIGIRLLFVLTLPLVAFTGDRFGAPQVTSTPVTSVKETELYEYLIEAEDPDGDAIEFIVKQMPSWLSLGPGDLPRVTTVLTINDIEGSKANPDSREPKLIASDGLGNLYMADVGHHVVRKISSSGEVTTLAGSGKDKYENGTGTGASFVELQGITVGPDGNIYVSEAGKGTDGKISHRIRKITPQGVVSNFVGREFIGDFDFHIGTSATFDTPKGLVFDSKGNLYVADSKNHNLRKVTPNGAVTTFAGIGKAPSLVFESGVVEGFHSMGALAVDSKDNIYVVNPDKNRIMVVDQEGVIRVFSGAAGIGDTEDIDGTQQFIKYWQPMGIAIDSDDNVYISDWNMKVKRISPDGKKVRHLAGNGNWEHKDGIGTAAAFQTPYSLAFDNFQNLYVAESGGHNLRRLSGSAIKGNPKGHAGVHDVSIEVKDSKGNSILHDFQITVEDEFPPSLVSILRQNPATEQLTSSEATFRVTFNEGVVNVNPADFGIKAGGSAGTVSTVTQVDTKTYDVKITGVSLKKVLDLDLLASTDIKDPAGFSITDFDVTDTEETYLGPNSPPVFTSTASTTANDGVEYKYTITASDVDGETPAIYSVTIPDWLKLNISYESSTLSGPPTTTQGVSIDENGNVHVGSVNDSFVGVNKVLSDGSAELLAGGAPGFAEGAGAAGLFRGVDDMAFDKDGNLYIADAENRSIRKIDTNGNVTTVLGEGQSTIRPNQKDGALNTATIARPQGLVLDSGGNIFYTDKDYLKIRKISAVGQVTSIAGRSNGFEDGTGDDAKFRTLAGIVMDEAGNLYVVDQGNHSIRKVTQAGVVTTLAGNGESGAQDGKGAEARFNSPTGIAIGPAGNLYIADTGNDKIRMVSPSGVVTTLELPGNDLDSPQRIAISNDGILYVTDSELKKFTPKGSTLKGTPSGVAGNFPVELKAVDASSASATQNFTISIEDSDPPVFTSGLSELIAENFTGIVHTVVATDLATLTYGLGNSMDEGLFSIDETFGEVTFLEAPDFENPKDANTNNEYEIEVTANDGSNTSRQVVKIKVGNLNDPPAFTSTPATEIKESEIYTYTPVGKDDDNSVLIYAAITLPGWLSFEKKLETEVDTHAGSGQAGKNNASLENAQFDHPYDLEFDLNGDLIVVDKANHMIRKIGKTSVSTFAGSGIAGFKDDDGIKAQFNEPSGIAISPNGTIYIADAGNHVIRKISSSGEVDTFSGDGTQGYKEGKSHESRFNGPAGMAVRGTDIYVADKQNHVIRKISSLGTVSTYAGTGTTGFKDGEAGSALFNLPTDLEFDSKGNLYVVDSGNNRIRKISTDGTVTTLIGNNLTGFTDGPEGMLNGPLGITIDDSDNIFFSESGNHAIRRISSVGVLSTWAGKGTSGSLDGTFDVATFNTPRGLAVEETSGEVYVADELNHKVRKITSSAGGYQLIGNPKGNVGEHTVKLTVSDGKETAEQEYVIKVIDGSAPKLVSIKRQSPAVEKLTNATAVFRVTFDEDIVAIDKEDFNLKNENSGEITTVTMISAKVYDVTVIKIPDNAIVALAFDEGHGIADTLNNRFNRLLDATSGEETYTGPDPLVLLSIKRQNPITEKLTTTEATFRVSFNEPVFNLDIGDFEIKSGLASGTVAMVTDVSNSQVFDVKVTGIQGAKAWDLDIVSSNDIVDSDEHALSSTNVTNEEETFIGINSAPEVTSSLSVTVFPGDKIEHLIELTDFEGDQKNLLVSNLPDWLTTQTEYKVSVLAGSGKAGDTDGSGTDAEFNTPKGMVLDSDGNLLVASSEGVRKVTRDGVVTTLSNLAYRAIAIDKSGKIAVATYSAISTMTPDGKVTPLAGSTAGYKDDIGTEAMFEGINGLVYDSNGDLYASADKRIRKVTSSGVVTTVAGSGSQGRTDGSSEVASFWSPSKMTFDDERNLLVADVNAYRIRKVDLTKGEVSTVAGSITPGYKDGELSEAEFGRVSSMVVKDGDIYFTEFGKSHALRVIRKSGIVETLAGSKDGNLDGVGTKAEFSSPAGLVLADDGTFYVHEAGNQVIRKIATGPLLEGTAPNEPGEYKIKLKATDEHGATSESELVIKVLTLYPNLLRIERDIPKDQLLATSDTEARFRLIFDREVAVQGLNTAFETKEGTAFAEPITRWVYGATPNEIGIEISSFSGFGELNLDLKDKNFVTSVLHGEALVSAEPTELEEIYILDIPVPSITELEADSEVFSTSQSIWTNDNTLIIKGASESGARVEVYLNGVKIGESQVGTDDKWQLDYTSTMMTDGVHQLTAKAFGDAHNLESGTSAAVELTVDTAAPEAPIINSITTDSGPNTTDYLTNDNTLIFDGNAEANSTVGLFVGGANIGTTNADGSGNFSFDHTSTTLLDNTYSITAKATDAAGNESVESSTLSVTIDTTSPTVSISSSQSNPTNANSIGITITFTESVIDFVLGNILVGNGTASNFSGSGTTYTADVTPTTDGTVTVDVNEGMGQDLAGNNNAAANQFSITYDAIAPTVPIITGITTDTGLSTSDGVTNDNTLSINGTSEANSNIEVFIDAVSIGATTTDGSGNFSYDHTGTTLVDGGYDITAQATDVAGNVGPTSSALSVTIETVKPTVTITSNAANPQSGAFTATFTFSEDVTGFVLEDITVGNGAAGNFNATSAKVYTATITPVADGVVTIDVAADKANDAAGNGNIAAVQLNVTNDETKPTVTLSAATSSPVNGKFTVTAEFSEDVSGLTLADINISGGSAADFIIVDGNTCTFTISSPGASATVSIAADKAQDAAGNQNTASNLLALTFDITPPDAPVVSSITTDSGSSSSDGITTDATLIFTGTAEANSTVEVFIGGTSIGTTAANGSGVWTYDHTGTTLADGTYSVTAKASDAAGNVSALSDELTVKVDNTAPTITANTLAGDDTINATEDNTSTAITGTTSGVEDGQLVTLVLDGVTYTDAVSNNEWRVSFPNFAQQALSPSSAMTIDVSDAAGNAATQITRTIKHDDVLPQSTLSTSAASVVNGAFTVTITFSETVVGFGLSDITVGNGIASALTVVTAGTVWTATITPTVAGSVTVDIAAGKATDTAGNPNTAATQLSRTFNNIPTDITLTPASILENSGAGATVGTLSTTDADAGDTHTYAFVSGTGDTDNGTFTITGTQVTANTDFDRETKSSYTIRVKTTDSFGATFEKEITITIDNVPEADMRITGDLQIPGTALGLTSTFNITIHNDGDATLTVSSITYPTAFGGPVTGITVTPGNSQMVNMTFSPTAAQTYSGDIAIMSNGGTGILAVTAEGSTITAIDDGQVKAEQIKVFPNPATDQLNIDLSEFNGKRLKISIHDLNGIKRYTRSNHTEDSLQVDVSAYSSGIYLVLLNDGEQVVQKKVMVRR